MSIPDGCTPHIFTNGRNSFGYSNKAIKLYEKKIGKSINRSNSNEISDNDKDMADIIEELGFDTSSNEKIYYKVIYIKNEYFPFCEFSSNERCTVVFNEDKYKLSVIDGICNSSTTNKIEKIKEILTTVIPFQTYQKDLKRIKDYDNSLNIKFYDDKTKIIDTAASMAILYLLNSLNNCFDEEGHYESDLLFSEEAFFQIPYVFEKIKGFEKYSLDELTNIIYFIARNSDLCKRISVEEVFSLTRLALKNLEEIKDNEYDNHRNILNHLINTNKF